MCHEVLSPVDSEQFLWYIIASEIVQLHPMHKRTVGMPEEGSVFSKQPISSACNGSTILSSTVALCHDVLALC